MAEDIDYQKVVDELDRQNFNAMEEKIEELEELINSVVEDGYLRNLR